MSSSIDLHNELTQTVSMAPIAIATDTTTAGAIIDTQGFAGLEFVITSGVLTDGAYTVTLEEGDNSALSDTAAPSSDFLTNTLASVAFALTEDGTTKSIGYVGHKRYVRLNIVSASTSSGGLFAVTAIQGGAFRKP